MNISIDGFRLVAEPRTSGAIYVFELVQALTRLPEVSNIFLILPRILSEESEYSELLTTPKIQFIKSEVDVFPEKSYLRQMLWIQYWIPRLLRKSGIESAFYIAPYHHPPLILSRQTEVITVIHDLCGLQYSKLKKGFYKHLGMLLISACRSDKIITISKYTQNELAHKFPWLRSRICGVVFNTRKSVSIEEHDVHLILKDMGCSYGGYYLVVGSPSVRKGTDITLSAFAQYQQSGGRKHLVMIAPRHTHSTLYNMIVLSGINADNVLLISSLSDQQLAAFYRGSIALLFPSRCEGFGYPLIEAMSQGCPPITYVNSPGREILGDTNLLMHNLTPDEVVRMMNHHELLDNSERAVLSNSLVTRAAELTSGDYGRHFFDAMTKGNESTSHPQ